MKIFSVISSLAAIVLGLTGTALALDYNADLSLSLSEQYNDNIFLSHTARVGDYITVINPAIILSTKTEKMDIMLNYSPSFNYYISHDEKNGISHQASAQGLFRLTERLSLGLSDSFVQTKETSIIRNIEGAGPLNAGQNRVTTNTFNGNFSYKLSEQFTLLPSLIYTVTNNSQQDTGNIRTFTGAMGASYLLTGRTTLRANAAYTNYDYTIGSDANGQEYIIGVAHKFTPTLAIDAFGGINVTSIKEPSRTDTGLTFGLAVTKIFEKGSASLSYKESVIPGLQSSSPLRSQVIAFTYTRPVTAALDSSISASYGHYKALGNVGPDQNRTDIGGNAGLSYRLLPWANLFLSYSYINSDDKVDKSGSYYNHIITAGIKLSKLAKF